MIDSPWPLVCIKSISIRNCRSTHKRTQGRVRHIAMASPGVENKQKCVAAVLEIERVQKEMPVLDHATRAADDRILLALFGTSVASFFI